MRSKYQTLLFDMDGTLIDTDLMIVLTFTELFALYRPSFVPSVKEMVYFSGPPLRETLAKYFPEQDQSFIFNEYKRLSRRHYQRYAKAFPDESIVLQQLKDQGYQLGIITAKTYDDTLMCLDLLGLDRSLFSLIIGSDNVAHQKPHPEGLLKALQALERPAKEVLYIGDNGIDAEFAHRAGVDVLLVTWNLREIPNSAAPTHQAKSFIELLEVVNDGA